MSDVPKESIPKNTSESSVVRPSTMVVNTENISRDTNLEVLGAVHFQQWVRETGSLFPFSKTTSNGTRIELTGEDPEWLHTTVEKMMTLGGVGMRNRYLSQLRNQCVRLLNSGVGTFPNIPITDASFSPMFALMLLFLTDNPWTLQMTSLANLQYAYNDENVAESDVPDDELSQPRFTMGRKIYEMILCFVNDPITHLRCKDSLPKRVFFEWIMAFFKSVIGGDIRLPQEKRQFSRRQEQIKDYMKDIKVLDGEDERKMPAHVSVDGDNTNNSGDDKKGDGKKKLPQWKGTIHTDYEDDTFEFTVNKLCGIPGMAAQISLLRLFLGCTGGNKPIEHSVIQDTINEMMKEDFLKIPSEASYIHKIWNKPTYSSIRYGMKEYFERNGNINIYGIKKECFNNEFIKELRKLETKLTLLYGSQKLCQVIDPISNHSNNACDFRQKWSKSFLEAQGFIFEIEEPKGVPDRFIQGAAIGNRASAKPSQAAARRTHMAIRSPASSGMENLTSIHCRAINDDNISAMDDELTKRASIETQRRNRWFDGMTLHHKHRHIMLQFQNREKFDEIESAMARLVESVGVEDNESNVAFAQSLIDQVSNVSERAVATTRIISNIGNRQTQSHNRIPSNNIPSIIVVIQKNWRPNKLRKRYTGIYCCD